jgi:hypothetical protein
VGCVLVQAVQKYEETIAKIKATPGAKVLCGGKRLQGTKVRHTTQIEHFSSLYRVNLCLMNALCPDSCNPLLCSMLTFVCALML